MIPQKLDEINYRVDLCVVGGGLAGLCAAVRAARGGSRVVLMQDRPVLGGNCSSENRMWIRGAGSRIHGYNETGITEEIICENMYRNPEKIYSIWDSVLYGKAKSEPNLTLLLNCTCTNLTMSGNKIECVRGFQLTTYTWYNIHAKIFADCSGDSILAPLSGAEYTSGRESKDKYEEEFAHDTADKCTMGCSCLLQARETDHKVTFIPPDWAYKFPREEDIDRNHKISVRQNFWWIEVGGEEGNTLKNAEICRDELLKIVFGIWDHIKNHCDNKADNWELDWVGFMSAKRESRRYIGDYILTQTDEESGGHFDDIVAYGGWPLDDHHPGGFRHPTEGSRMKNMEKPYGIPYRSLYSVNIENLMFAGRNISASHIALSSTRVMKTCAVLGEAVGAAAAIAIREGLSPREVGQQRIAEIQNTLLENDCYLPHLTRKISALSLKSKLATDDCGDVSVLLNGTDRSLNEDNGFYCTLGKTVTYLFDKETEVDTVRIIFDSDLCREHIGTIMKLDETSMIGSRFLKYNHFDMPHTMTKEYKIEILDKEGKWNTVVDENNNYQRFVKKSINTVCCGVRFVPLATYGEKKSHIFSFEVIGKN